MLKKTYTDLMEHDHQLTVDSRGTIPVRFQLDDGCETIIAFLGFDDVWALYNQLGEWLNRYLDDKHEETEDVG